MLKIIRPDNITPTHVQIEVTWRCNWRCVHCYQDDHHQEVFTFERLKSLFREMSGMGTMHVIVTGGEPLVRKDIFEVFDAIREQRMAITLYTNGHLIDDDVADRLSKQIAVAEISILAGNENIHDQLSKVKGSFHRALNAIKILRKRNVDVVVKTPILKPSYHTLKDLEMLMMQLGVQWTVDPEITRSYAGASYPLQYQMSFDELQQFFREFPQFNPHNGYNADPGVRNGLCLAARQYCFIDAFGNVYPCLNFKSACDVQEAKGQKVTAKLGNVFEEPFKVIWKTSLFAQQVRAAKLSSFTTCNTCQAQGSCNPCMALNYEENGKLFQPASAVCKTTKAARSIKDPNFLPASELARKKQVL